MRRDIKSLPFFILGALVLLGLTTCKPKNETDSSKKVPEQALSALNTCNPETYKYSKDTAKIDSSIYSAVIDIITPKSVRDCIENPTVGYFPISLTSINTLKQKEENCEILPADGHNDPSWFYFAIKPGVKNEKDTISTLSTILLSVYTTDKCTEHGAIGTRLSGQIANRRRILMEFYRRRNSGSKILCIKHCCNARISARDFQFK